MKNRDRFLLSIVFAALFILVHGYQFNNGDQEEHLPYVYKLLDPSLYTNDYIVPIQSTQFTIRYYFAHLIRLGSFLMPVSAFVFFIYFLCLSTFGFVIASVTEKMSKSKLAASIALLLIIILNNFSVGGNSFFDIQLTSSCVALALGMLGYSYFEKEKYISAAALCGLASLFQVLIGMQLFLLFMLGSIFTNTNDKLKTLLLQILFYLLFAGAMLFPLLQLQFGKLSSLESPIYFDILFNFRNAHHYNPACFPLTDYLKTTCWWLLILFSIYSIRKENQYRNQVLFMLISLAGCIVYYIGFTHFHLPSIGKTQWFKSTVWPGIIGVIPVAIYINNKIDNKIPNLKSWRTIQYFVLIVSMLFIFNSALIPIDKFKSRYKVGNYPQSHLEKMHEWISKNTDNKAVFLTMPNDDSFLCEAKRSMPVGYKAIIHQPDFLLKWYDNMNAIYGVKLSHKTCRNISKEAAGIYHLRTDTSLSYTGRIDYRLWNMELMDSSLIDWKALMHRESNILLLPFVKNVKQ